MGAHGRHGKVSSKIKQADTQHQQYRADGKGDQLGIGKIKQRSQRQNITIVVIGSAETNASLSTISSLASPPFRSFQNTLIFQK